MLTRIVTQPLPPDAGDEQAALESVYSQAPATREILRHHGRASIQFSKVAVSVATPSREVLGRPEACNPSSKI